LRHLIGHGATQLLLANRTRERAEHVAAEFRTAAIAVEVIPFEDLCAQAWRADIVITSTGATQQIFGRANGLNFVQRRRGRPMFFIDIAVPRDVDPRMNEVDGCFVYDIDDLQQVAQANQADRSKEAAAAERIVADEVTRYHRRLESLVAVPAIVALQRQAEEIRLAELARIGPKLASLSPVEREAIDSLTRALTAKLLHPQLVALKQPKE
jgi:glutamyl-tRNA reductase